MMISPLSVLKLIYNFFLFQTVQIFCINEMNMQHLKRTAKQIFRYDFNTSLEEGKVLIWQISGNEEPYTLLQYNGEDVKFGSEQTYVIVILKFKKTLIVYYWLGGHSSLVDKKRTAMYVIFLSCICKPELWWSNISRETEGMESDSFQETMKMFNRHTTPHMEKENFASYLDSYFLSPRPNLYVVWGERYSRIKKVPLSLGTKWLKKKDICLVLEAEFKVDGMLPMNIYCGAEANKNQIIRSKSLAGMFACYYSTSELTFKHYVENNNDFKQFLEVLEDYRLYNPNEMDNSGDYLMNPVEFFRVHDRKILLFDVTDAGLQENPTRPIHSGNFQWYNSMGYLLDTKSVAGTFLVLADSENLQGRIKAIKLAEDYMDEKYPLSSGKMIRMRIIESRPIIHQAIDFQINLSDYPSPLMSTLPDYELVQ